MRPEAGGHAYDSSTDRARRPDQLRRVVLASFVGTTIEWYDFFLYGTAAALVFNRLFFPTLDPVAGTLSAYGTFAVGFVARPLGGGSSVITGTGWGERPCSCGRW